MNHETVDVALKICLIVTVSSLLVMALRIPLRRLFGANIAYAMWLLIPLSVIIASIPSQPEFHQIQGITQPVTGLIADRWPSPPTEKNIYVTIAVTLWLAGSLLLFLWFLLQQTVFERKLGKLTPRGGVYISESVHFGPLLLGLWRPKIIVPADFYDRFHSQQQQLIIAHEKTHAKRKDPLFNAFCASLQTLFWFNPVVHIAARYYRADQELSCDQLVLNQYPLLKRQYAETLLNTFSNTLISPTACPIKPYRNLKERIMNIHKPQKQVRVLLLGKIAVIFLLSCGCLGARAISPAITDGATASTHKLASKGNAYKVDFDIQLDGVNSTPTLISQENEEASIEIEGKTAKWKIDYSLSTVNMEEEGLATMIAIDLKRNNQSISQPSLLIKNGETAMIKGNGEQQPGSGFTIAMTPRLHQQ